MIFLIKKYAKLILRKKIQKQNLLKMKLLNKIILKKKKINMKKKITKINEFLNIKILNQDSTDKS